VRGSTIFENGSTFQGRDIDFLVSREMPSRHGGILESHEIMIDKLLERIEFCLAWTSYWVLDGNPGPTETRFGAIMSPVIYQTT